MTIEELTKKVEDLERMMDDYVASKKAQQLELPMDLTTIALIQQNLPVVQEINNTVGIPNGYARAIINGKQVKLATVS